MFFDQAWQNKLHRIINDIDTPMGRAFDISLIVSIVASSIAIIIDSVATIHEGFGFELYVLQMVFLFFFTVEYILRIIVAPYRKEYIFSFYGIVDFFAIAPIAISLVFPLGGFFPIIRSLRLLRLFSVFKMGRYIDESGVLLKALRASRAKITVFLFTILFIIVIVGSTMYTIEGPENGFINIPESMYWTVVTISTVGYGDISPQTQLGKILASGLMLVGYGIIAVPTGIITSEMTSAKKDQISLSKGPYCANCGTSLNGIDAQYCYSCGKKIASIKNNR